MKPARAKRFDRFTAPDASPADTINWHVCAAFDEACRRMDLKWGVDRLPGLVPVEMAERYGKAVAALNEAIRKEDNEAVRQNAENCARGLAKLDAIAEASGASKSDPQTISFSDGDQFAFVILKDERDWPALKAANPDLLFFTRGEVVNAMKAWHSGQVALEHVRKSFPDAKISKITARDWNEEVGDSIPY